MRESANVKVDVSKIVNQVDLKRAIEFYTGRRFSRSGFINCPFHNDATPSLSIKGDRFHCFSCDRGGDVIDFTRAYFNLGFREACKRLSDDFGLGLDFDGYEEKKRKPDLWARKMSDHAEQRVRAIKRQIETIEKEQNKIEIQIQKTIQKKPVNWKEIDRLEDEADRKANTICFMRAL